MSQSQDATENMESYERSLGVLCFFIAAALMIPGAGNAVWGMVAVISSILCSISLIQIRRGFKNDGRITLIASLIIPLSVVLLQWMQALLMAT